MDRVMNIINVSLAIVAILALVIALSQDFIHGSIMLFTVSIVFICLNITKNGNNNS